MLQEILSIIYDWLPKSVRAFISPVVEPSFFFIKRVLLVASQFRLSAYLLQGKEKCGSGSLTTLFFGGEIALPYLSSLLYSEEPVKESLGKVFIWKVRSKLDLDIPEADLIFIGLDRFFSRFLCNQGFILIPEWVLFIMDLSKPLTEIWKLPKNKSLKENLREIKRHRYSFEMTSDPAKFEYFYHQMYLPYTIRRFGKLTLPTGFRYMKRIFEKGMLLLVKRGDEHISGILFRIHNKTVFVASIGIREGKIEYRREGALAACYYFIISWAKEKGYKWVDFGHCRPLFNDGVFFHKKKWGMEIKRSDRVRGILGMKICNFRQEALDFLAKNPFIFVEKEKLNGLVLTEQDHPLTLVEVQALFKTHYIPGVDCLTILSPQGFTQQAEKFAASQFTERLHLKNLNPVMFYKRFPIFSPDDAA